MVTFYQYNPWWEKNYHASLIIPRQYLEKQLMQLMPTKAVIFLTGLRRVGKTTLMKIAIDKLIAQGIEPTTIYYFSMDDYLLGEQTILDLEHAFRKLHGLASDQKIYLFLDEITAQANFRHQLKNLYDRGQSKIIVSSSSSSALRDNRGWLTGRERHIELQPLNFAEFLQFRHIEVKKRDAALLENYFEQYMQVGGMPEYVLNQDRAYLTTLVDDILYKDIIAFHGIKHPQVIKDFFHLLMERSGKQVSLNKVARILNISVDSVRRYMTMFEQTYLIYLVPRYGKTNETILSPKKIYAADIGIRHLFTGLRDKGAIFENIVFSMIKHRNPCYYYELGNELDFVTEDGLLIEAKFGQALTQKQQALFDKVTFKNKIIVDGLPGLVELERKLST